MAYSGQVSTQPRKQQLSEKDLKVLRTIVHRLPLSNGAQICYNLGLKDSSTGLFSNERLLVLNTKNRTLSYFSKLPQGIIPLQTEEQLNGAKCKEKITGEEVLKSVKDFKCFPVAGKTSTFTVELNKTNKIAWTFQMANKQLMTEWVSLINNCLPKPIELIQTPKVPPPIPEQIRTSLPNSRKLLAQNQRTEPERRAFEIIPEQVPIQQSQKQSYVPQKNTQSRSQLKLLDESSLKPNQLFTDLASELKYRQAIQPNMFKTKNDTPHDNRLEENQNMLTNPIAQPKTFAGYNPIIEPLRLQSTRNRASRAQLREFQVQSPQNMLQLPSRSENEGYKSKSSLDSNRQYQLVGVNNFKKKSLQKDPEQVDSQPLNVEDVVIPEVFVKSRPHQEEPPKNSNSRILEDRPVEISSLSRNQSHASKGPRRRFNRKRWNQIFAETANKLEVYEDFIAITTEMVQAVIDQLPLPKKDREFAPVQISGPIETYADEGIVMQLHIFEERPHKYDQNARNAPVCYDQASYDQMKRQFEHYNLLLAVTSNEGFIKVPLSAYFQYKGVIAFCKAEIPPEFLEVAANKYQKQFQILENQIKVRFMFGEFLCFCHPQSKYILLDGLTALVPAIPSLPNSCFRKEFLLQYPSILQDTSSCLEAQTYCKEKLVPQIANCLELMEVWIVNSADLHRELHSFGLSMSHLPLIYQRIQHHYFKRLLASEMVANIFTLILRSQISLLMRKLPLQNSPDNVLLDCCHMMVDQLFSYSRQSLWKVLTERLKLSFNLVISKEDVMPGFLFSSILTEMGIATNFRNGFNPQAEFFVQENTIPRELLTSFSVRVKRYDLSSISGLVQQVEDILACVPSPESFKQLVEALRLKQELIPSFLEAEEQRILAFMCNFVPYSEHEQFEHLGIYNMLLMEPHSACSLKVSLLAAKWCVKKKLIEESLRIFENKCLTNSLWMGQYNQLNGEFYDFFAMYYASVGNYEEAVRLAKASLFNIVNILNKDALPVADKHYQLGNIYFKLARKEDAFKQYLHTKNILNLHSETQIPEYAIILLKLALLQLTFGKVEQCIDGALEALRIFEQNATSQQDELETFEVLARCYEITQREAQLKQIGSLCSKRFNNTDNAKILQRMIKIVIYPLLRNLSSADGKALRNMFNKLHEQGTTSPLDAFIFLKKKSEQGSIMKYIGSLLDNVVLLSEEANRKDLVRKHRSLDRQAKSEAEDLLIMLDVLGALCGYEFVIGAISDSSYQ